MRFALCNEVLQPMPFGRQCEYAAALGYDGIELAPFTISDDPHQLSDVQIATLRRAASDAGIEIMGLHYLLVAPKGLSITSPDDAQRRRTVDVMLSLIDLCAELGGRYMVHGSQRVVAEGETPAIATARARDCFAAIASRAESNKVRYCIEALARGITPVISDLTEAAAIVDSIKSPAVMTMIDTNHASKMEGAPLAEVIDRWLPTGKIGHVQINDPNLRGPGQGEVRFTPIFEALRRNGYPFDVSMEPMKYVPDGAGSAARAIGYARGILEALDLRTPARH